MSNHTSTNNLHILPLFIDGSSSQIAFFLIHLHNEIAFSGEGNNFGREVGSLMFSDLVKPISKEEETRWFLGETYFFNSWVITELLEELLVIEWLFWWSFFEII
jgi:hypothetical protein